MTELKSNEPKPRKRKSADPAASKSAGKAAGATTSTPAIASVSLERVTREKPSAADRHSQVALEAYLLAERRGFEPGHEVEDWLAAERSVSARS